MLVFLDLHVDFIFNHLHVMNPKCSIPMYSNVNKQDLRTSLNNRPYKSLEGIEFIEIQTYVLFEVIKIEERIVKIK